MLIRTLKMTFWVVYDHLGKLLAANLLCALWVAAPALLAFRMMQSGNAAQTFYVGVPLLLLIPVAVIPLAQAGMLWMVKELIEKHDGSLKTFFAGIRKFWGRAIIIGVLMAFFSLCLLISVWFYGARLGGVAPVFGYALSAAALWAQILLLLASLLVLPALVNKNGGVADSFKTAAVLIIDNPLFAAGVGAHAALLLAFCVAPPVFLFFSFAPLAALQGSAYEMLSRKY
ncbi:MAG TPA: hypothetical protein ENN29_11795, partial [Candidatus Hydrogenedentes bacterium]|nr:hypothetical protein [Candidatus Hydrogenedentota bacterium]